MKRILGISLCVLLTTIAFSVSGQVPFDEDPAWISSQYYTVRFENDQIRVLEFRTQPGDKDPMHSHTARVIYYLSDATFRETLPNGTVSEGSARKGDVQWADFHRHATENIGMTEAHVLTIEIK